ncbi:MAG: flagellar basal body-associated FliL family protein [Candidatus Marinimicrobia bacterium]|nr:flagellar basal body-associated FliL family protein [Candidatus Neomarinimicrobiota bacterium]MCF7880509.1 flagellar basal body-associated FliL family protein [Candidatus Neomarinimicrobiota bacterium]
MADDDIQNGENTESGEVKTQGINPWIKRLLMFGAVLLVIGIELGISYVLNKRVVVPKYFSEVKEKPKGQDGKKKKEEKKETEQAELNTNIYLVDNIVINPKGTNGTRYIAMAVGLGVNDPGTLEKLKNRDIQIRDAMNALLADKSLGEFVDMENRPKLKREILNTVNDKIGPNEVESIYFTEYVIQ